MPRKTRANKVPSTPAVSPSRVQLFRNERAREAYEKLNSKRKIWAERSVILDEVMSHITGSSIQWGSDPRITSSALTETAYLFLRVACHSLWPFLISTPFLWSDVCFYMRLCLVLLSVFLTCSFVP